MPCMLIRGQLLLWAVFTSEQWQLQSQLIGSFTFISSHCLVGLNSDDLPLKSCGLQLIIRCLPDMQVQ
ncbi:hypothetical protein OUZ56_019646 [Daphnia magna]|uniref:Secreted protein n=1 Tax=Daphnia magna TaxID=35525 RepID=A0ABQ9ZC69_9CRUS|nr:hypothetical protein OUZ56_019646 [Daphnia magna]